MCLMVTFFYVNSSKYGTCILDNNGNPTQQLLDLLDVTKISHDGTLESIVAATQHTQNNGGWLRTHGKERWETKECFEEKRKILFPMFDQLGILQEITPLNTYYDYALLLGATIHSIRLRLKHLIDIWNQGIRFGTIIILSGQRNLDPGLEPLKVLINHNNGILPFKKNWQFNGKVPKTETDMIKLVFEQSELPEEWENISIIFIDTPKKQATTGEWQRPTTQDTVIELLKTNPKPGSILVISNQPYIGYQNAVLLRFIPDIFEIETIGKAASSKEKITTLLDTIARWLYVEYHRKYTPTTF